MSSGYVGIDKDYFVSVKEVLNITAETGAWETQTRVRNLLPADVVEVRHGKPKIVKRKHWVDDYKNLDGTLFECSEVLVEYEEESCPFCGKVLGDFNSYCGNCGAKMDGKKQEHE